MPQIQIKEMGWILEAQIKVGCLSSASGRAQFVAFSLTAALRCSAAEQSTVWTVALK